MLGRLAAAPVTGTSVSHQMFVSAAVQLLAMASRRLTAVDCEQVERDETDTDRAVAVEHPLAEKRPVRCSAFVERDEFAVEHETAGKNVELRHLARHVPAASAANTKAVLGRDDRAEPVPLEFERPLVAFRESAGARQHRGGQHPDRKLPTGPYAASCER